jgi:hypothetical protein
VAQVGSALDWALVPQAVLEQAPPVAVLSVAVALGLAAMSSKVTSCASLLVPSLVTWTIHPLQRYKPHSKAIFPKIHPLQTMRV